MPGGSLFETFMGMGGGLQLMWFIGVCLTKSWNPAANLVFIVGCDRTSFPFDQPYYRDLLAGHIAGKENVVMYVAFNLTQVPEVLIFYVLFFHAPPED